MIPKGVLAAPLTGRAAVALDSATIRITCLDAAEPTTPPREVRRGDRLSLEGSVYTVVVANKRNITLSKPFKLPPNPADRTAPPLVPPTLAKGGSGEVCVFQKRAPHEVLLLPSHSKTVRLLPFESF